MLVSECPAMIVLTLWGDLKFIETGGIFIENSMELLLLLLLLCCAVSVIAHLAVDSAH
jgi:hypothetical protein